ncbi:MAG: HD domain-containing protein [Pyrinomonadaceae bacterium]|nr:HD domain-containing protein [Pyrinomonadaceae bacterium]
MSETFKRTRLLYIVLGTLLVVGLLPLALAGWLLSERSADELRAIEGRYQAQLVQDKARQIELYGQRYREVVTGLARAFELAGDVRILKEEGSDVRLQKTLQQDANLIALAILPISGEPHVAYKPDVIGREEVDEQVGEGLAHMSGRGLVISLPRIIRSSQEMGWAVAAPVMGGASGDEVVAAVVAIISFQEVFDTVQQSVSKSERELLDQGLPVIFVVNAEGRAVAHPEARVAFSAQSMTDLKVVQDWIASGAQVQSALAPFTIEREGRQIEMLGSYATAELDAQARLGVIAIQDEHAALRSVSDMRWQTLAISLLAAVFALLIGLLFAKQLTRPVRDLADGARRIAAGDFSQRIHVQSRTELGELGRSFNSMTDQLESFIEDLRHAAEENRQLFLGTVKAFAAAIDGKDPYTRGHSERVSRFSVAIAQSLGLAENEIEKIRISALLHDVGKIAIDDAILKKTTPLTAEEYELMKEHPGKGYKIMSQIPVMREFLPGILMHHEMVDGRGYPQGLRDEQLPLLPRVIAVADTFDAMTTERPYQQAMNFEDAIARIKSFVGTRYDPRIVEAFIRACEAGRIRPGSAKLRPETSKVVEATTAPRSNQPAHIAETASVT